MLAAARPGRARAPAHRALAPAPVSGDEPDDGYTRVAGVVHVHTTLSDGGGTPDEVVAAAQRAGLGFLAITDHNNLDAKPVEGYHGGVLVLVGSELSTTAGHLLGLGIAGPGLPLLGRGPGRARGHPRPRRRRVRRASHEPARRLPLDGLGPARALGPGAAQRRQRVAAGQLGPPRASGRALPAEPAVRAPLGPHRADRGARRAGTGSSRAATSPASWAPTPTAGCP